MRYKRTFTRNYQISWHFIVRFSLCAKHQQKTLRLTLTDTLCADWTFRDPSKTCAAKWIRYIVLLSEYCSHAVKCSLCQRNTTYERNLNVLDFPLCSFHIYFTNITRQIMSLPPFYLQERQGKGFAIMFTKYPSSLCLSNTSSKSAEVVLSLSNNETKVVTTIWLYKQETHI